MTASHVSVLAWIVLGLTVFRYTTALPFDEPVMPLQPVSRSAVENSRNRGFMWVPRKPKQSNPRGRYEGGYDMTFLGSLGVCRMRHADGVHPGKVFDRGCNIGYGHKEIIGKEYDVLVARRDAFWHMAPDEDMDLNEALTGGREANGQPLKLCVARHRTGWGSFSNYLGYHPGKYVWGRCNFGFADQEISGDDYYLLALGSKPKPKAGAIGVNGERATPSVDSGTMTRDAESPVSFADAGDVDAAAASGVDASDAAAVDSRPHGDGQNSGQDGGARATWSPGPVPQLDCLYGEVTCHCDKLSGCTLPGYCPCSI
ncbi:MAG TPA: DM9 repeat-containing protein [Polyangiaceae bacterium]